MRRSALFIIATLATATAAHADVYKSVDANGQVRYSDVWSAGATLIKGLSLHNGELTASDSASSTPPRATNDHTPDPSKLAAQKAVAQDVAAARTDQCKQLKDQYDKEIHARRIRKADSNADDPQYMTEDEVDAERVKTKQAMDDACGTAD